MKKLFLTFLICLLFSRGSYAQDGYKHDIQLGAGLRTSEYAALEGYINLFMILILKETITPFERGNGLYGTYRYRITRRISAGLTAGATLLNTREPVFDHSGTPGDYRYVSALLAAEAQFHYIDRPRWSLYGIAGAGLGRTSARNSGAVTNTVEKSRYPLATIQVTPIGVRYGKTVGIFAELGYGYKGILNTGVSLRLK